MSYIGRTPIVGNFVKLDAITTSATTTFNLTNGGVAYSPQSANHCIVSLNGVIQSPNTSFTISGSTIVFASALTSSDVIDFILVLGDVLNIGTPSDATVGFSKITSNLITGATAETSIAGGDSILIYDDSATALRKMTRTNFVAGVGGTNTPAFSAERTTSQSVSSATNTEITYPTEIFDNGNCYDTSTGRFTPTTAGNYFITATIKIPSLGDAKEGYLQLRKNGIYPSSEAGQKDISGANYDSVLSASIILNFNGTTDYVSIWCYHDASGARNILGTFGAIKIIE